jgi:hypothetical protein
MIALWLIIGLIVGALGGWMLCALCTMAVHIDQIDRLGRQRYAIREFLARTEPYHDDPRLAQVRSFAQELLEKEAT